MAIDEVFPPGDPLTRKDQDAVLNILEDADSEQRWQLDTQKAILKILEDIDAERVRAEETQSATLNILEDIRETEEDLRRTMTKLELSNSELQQFAYVASHDLQEPLRMVASFLQLLWQRYSDKLDEDALEFINFAVDGANRMQTMINDLLLYSRVGTRGGEFSEVDSEELLSEAQENLKVAIAESGARVTHGRLPNIFADRSQIVQLMQNLIGNAIKFQAAARPPRVHVAAKLTGDEWQFSVTDNGIGIDPEFSDRIFIIFQRLHGKTEYPGTGIGLSVCKRIVERHDGRIWAESEPGHGSTFFFTIPITPAT